MAGYSPLTDSDREAMLGALGLDSVDQLFETVPEQVRLDRPLDLAPGAPENEVFDRMSELASRNRDPEADPCFLGAGMYDHYVPAIVDAITSR
jgi:glycine dehydrogenase subunit 1